MLHELPDPRWDLEWQHWGITRCLLFLNAERIYSHGSSTPIRPSASLTRATHICSCCECWQWFAQRSRSWLEILEDLGPTQAPTMLLWKDWGKLKAACAPALQQDRLAALWGTPRQTRCKTKMCMWTSKSEGSVNHYCTVQIKTHQTSLLEIFQLIDMNLMIRLTNIFSWLEWVLGAL